MESITSFLDKTWYHNTLWDWTISLSLIFGAVIIARIVYWIFGKTIKRLTSKTKSRLDDILVDMLEEPIILAIVIIGFWWGIERLEFPDAFQNWINKVYHILIAINVTWLIARLADALIEEYLIPLTKKSESDLDDQLMPILRKGTRWMIWTLGIIIALNNAGYNVGALLAGLGIGGIAMAMAAKDFVANIFGGITVFVDKPFRISDRIEVGGYDGFVRDMGIRSTKIETLAGRIVTIPNHKFTDSFVENISAEPTRKVILKLGLTYNTPPQKLQEAQEILKNIVAATDEITNESIIGFTEFGDSSLGITFIYYIHKESPIIETNSKVNMEILTRFNDAHLNFAFPTRTIITENA